MLFPSRNVRLCLPLRTKIRGKNPTVPVRIADISNGRRLQSPGVQNAMIPDAAISPATNNSETPVYQVIIFQFMSFCFARAKI